MSVYRDTNASVTFEHPHPGPLVATVYREGETNPILTTSGLNPTSGKYTLALDWSDTQYDGNLSITWSDADDFERTQVVEVVTPLVSLSRLRTLFPGENKSDSELSELEQTVRVFIEAYCGQSFGFWKGTKTITTKGGRATLSQRLGRLISVTAVNGMTLRPSDDAFTLYVTPAYQTLPADASELDIAIAQDGDLPHHNYVIYAPGQKVSAKDATFTVTGVWGYEMMPDEVQEAAMLMANDFSCNEITYRDRYLESVKIQQDTIVYHPGAFRGTGNARADLLLAKYRRTGMAII